MSTINSKFPRGPLLVATKEFNHHNPSIQVEKKTVLSDAYIPPQLALPNANSPHVRWAHHVNDLARSFMKVIFLTSSNHGPDPKVTMF